MKRKRGSEMSKLIWSFTIPVLLLVAIIVGFYLIEGIARANNNAKHTKQLLIDQTVQSYKRIGENFQTLNFNPETAKLFNPEIVNAVFSGDMVPLYGVAKTIMSIASPAKYVGIIVDGKVVDYTLPYGSKVDPNKLPITPPSGPYLMLDGFGGSKGTFVDVFYSMDLSKVGLQSSKIYVSAIFDLTRQVKEIESYFKDQKNDTVIILVITGIVALILFALLSTFWLRYLISKYIRKPVANLNAMAEEIADGTFEGDVVVVQGSDFAALQGLLKSGQLVLRKHDQKMSDESS